MPHERAGCPYSATTLSRRLFCTSATGAYLIVSLARLQFWADLSLVPAGADADPEYIVVNGWILTRADFVATETTKDVIRFQ